MFKVTYTKNFVAGNMKGITFNSASTFNDIKNAAEFMSYLGSHAVTPVDALTASNYTVSNVKLEVQVS